MDEYGNLLVLCKVHHKLVDDQESTFTAELLRQLKTNHEAWVRNKLRSDDREEDGGFNLLTRLTTGKSITHVIAGTYGFYRDYDEPATDAERHLVAEFFHAAADWNDLGLDQIHISMDADRHFSELLTSLEKSGYWVFGSRETETRKDSKGSYPWPVARLVLVRNANNEIINLRPTRGEAASDGDVQQTGED